MNQSVCLCSSEAAEEELVSLQLQSVIRRRRPVSPQDQKQTSTLSQPMRRLHGDPSQREGAAFHQQPPEGRPPGRPPGGGEAGVEEVQGEDDVPALRCLRPPCWEAQARSQRTQ